MPMGNHLSTISLHHNKYARHEKPAFSSIPLHEKPAFSSIPRHEKPAFSSIPRHEKPAFSSIPRHDHQAQGYLFDTESLQTTGG